jgi:type II secretory pathway pseudopilin PulG
MRAFTLIETLIYIGIFSLILASIFSSAIILHDSAVRTHAEASALQERLIKDDAL